MTFEQRRAMWLAEAHEKARAGIRVELPRALPTPPPHLVVATQETALGTFRVERTSSTKRPWAIVGPSGRVWAYRHQEAGALAALARFARQWPVTP